MSHRILTPEINTPRGIPDTPKEIPITLKEIFKGKKVKKRALVRSLAGALVCQMFGVFQILVCVQTTGTV